MHWFHSYPAGGQHPNEVSAGENQHVPLNRSHAAHYIISTCFYLCRRFASRAPVAEQLPVRPLGPDLRRPETLIFAVVPLDEIAIDFGDGSESSQGTGLAGALQRTGEHLVECQARQPVR